LNDSRGTIGSGIAVADPDDLAGIPLFDSLSQADIEQLATWFAVKTVSEGVRLATEGASGYSFFVLVAGGAVVTSDGETVATCGPGDFFGEMAILDSGRRSATVTTTSPAKLLVMFGTEFRRLEQAHPTIAAELEKVTRQRRRKLHQFGADAPAGI
jgi:CRP-like cAMP-binding protein